MRKTTLASLLILCGSTAALANVTTATTEPQTQNWTGNNTTAMPEPMAPVEAGNNTADATPMPAETPTPNAM